MLIQIGNTYVNTAHIVTVKHLRAKSKEHEQCHHHTLYVDLIGGERVSCSYASAAATPWELDTIEQALQSTVAAAPGFYVLQFYDAPDGEDIGYSKRPVLAWSQIDDFMMPMCAETIVLNDYAILDPDGRVLVPDGGIYRSLAQWHTAELAEHKAKQARSAATP